MKLTKQQKVLSLVAVLGVGAVGLDRLVLGSPESVSASVAPDAAAALAAEAASTAQQTATPDDSASIKTALPSFESLTERLARASDTPATSPDKDPFRLPDEWVPQAVQEIQAVQNAQPLQSESTQLLLDQFTLDGTFRSVIDESQEQVAVINGRAMRVGDRIVVRLGKNTQASDQGELYELLKVGTRAVVFASVDTGQQVVLRAPNVLE